MFLAFKQVDSMIAILFLKTIWKLIHVFSFTQFDSMKPIQFLKTYEKNVYKCMGFLYENYQQQANALGLGDFLRAIEKIFKKKIHKIQKNSWNLYLSR